MISPALRTSIGAIQLTEKLFLIRPSGRAGVAVIPWQTASLLHNKRIERRRIMVIHDWSLYANLLAILSRKSFAHIRRAAFRLDVDNESLVIALFGNDGYQTNPAVQKEIDRFRSDIVETGNEELGFGLSPDGLAWAIVIKPDLDRNQTVPARIFQMEMLKSSIEDLVTGNRAFSFAFEPAQTRGSVSAYYPAK
jgi:hypothetical protein